MVALFRLLWVVIAVAILLFGSATLRSAFLRLSPLLFIASFLPEVRPVLDFPGNYVTTFFGCASLIIITLCVFRRRFFCRYVCPLGAAVDVAANGRRRLFKSNVGRFGLIRPTKLLFCFFLLLWTFALICSYFHISCPLLPQDLPPFAFDPMALVSRWFHENTFSISLLVFILCFVVSPFCWRFHICPCGALQELIHYPIRMIKRIRNSYFTHSSKRSPKPTIAHRRNFFATSAAIAAIATIGYLSRKGIAQRVSKSIRPPGASSEISFITKCARCGLCIESCPNGILRASDSKNAKLSKEVELFSPKLPAVDFTLGVGYCEKECIRCATVCPTGALSKLTAEDKWSTPIGKARFTFNRCLLYYQQECSICRRECPYEAIEFVWSEDDYEKLPVIDEDKCVGCGRCVAFCPGEPIFNEDGEIEEGNENQKQSRSKALEITPI